MILVGKSSQAWLQGMEENQICEKFEARESVEVYGSALQPLSQFPLGHSNLCCDVTVETVFSLDLPVVERTCVLCLYCK